MVSNIDETKPVTGIDQPAKVMRDNFTIAKIEITELQARKYDLDGSSSLTGPLGLVSFTLAELPPAIDNEGSLVYVSDSSPPSPFYSDGLIWRAVGSGALVDIVDDTTPQLGGDLDVNGFSIVSVSDGDILITPDGTGTIILDGLSWPFADGTNGQVLTTDGFGNLSFTTIVSGGLNNIVEDVTPQLGAQLDVNTFGLGDGTNLLIDFVEDASAVNYIQIENEATGSGPIIRSVGADTNIDMNIEPKGTGSVIVGLTGPSEIRGDTNENLTVGGGDSDATAVGGNTIIVSGDGSGAFASGDITITPGTGGASNGDLILSGLIWPIVDGTSGQALTTNGAGTLGFATVGSINDVVDDTTPQLGGDLDVNGNSIVSVSDGDIPITPDGTGTVILDGLNWPQADGSNGQVLTTDGVGNLSFGAGGGGSAFTTQIATSTPIAAVDDDEILVDTSSLAITVNLPASPTLGDRVRIVDGAGNASSFNITVGRNGEPIMGVAANFTINVDNAGAEFVYMDGTNGWRVVNNV